MVRGWRRYRVGFGYRLQTEKKRRGRWNQEESVVGANLLGTGRYDSAGERSIAQSRTSFGGNLDLLRGSFSEVDICLGVIPVNPVICVGISGKLGTARPAFPT